MIPKAYIVAKSVYVYLIKKRKFVLLGHVDTDDCQLSVRKS